MNGRVASGTIRLARMFRSQAIEPQEKRMRLVAISAAICLVALGPALGQSGNTGEKLDQGNTAQGANQNPQGANQNGQGANQNANGNPAAGDASAFHDQVKNGLQQAGFSDVQVVPRSFLVRAKDKDGQLVTMLINGNSIIQINGLPDDDAATTGSGMNSDTDPGSAPGANTGGSSGANPDSGK